MASINYSGFGIYNADVCLCIDRSVCNKPLYSTLVGNLSRIGHDINTVFEEKATLLTNLRIRFVFFGNNYGDDQSIIQSPFFLPYEQEQISTFIHRSRVHPANGMEALECAMKSEWCAEGWRKRHIIVLITDTFPKEEASSDCGLSLSDFQNEQVQMYESLTKQWGTKMEPGVMNDSAKRLVLFTPNVSIWHMIVENWNNTVLQPINGCSNGCSYQSIVTTIVNCIG